MTVTFDGFVMTSNELVALMTGVPMSGPPPVLINRSTGASARCSPTRISGTLGMCASFGMTPGRGLRPRDNAWCAVLPITDGASEVPLSIVIDGVVRNATVRRAAPAPASEPEPDPASPPRRALRRARKRA